MTYVQTLHLEHLPPGHAIHIGLYRNIQNAEFLHKQLLAGNTDFEYALIDASVIISRVHVLAAVYRAVHDLLSNKLKSRNVHSEIVFSLSPNNNISESFRRFGISPQTTTLLVIKVTLPAFLQTLSTPQPTEADIYTHITTSILGDLIPFTDTEIATITDVARVKKIYKLNVGGGKKKGEINGDGGDERKEIEIMVLGAMALRGATN